MKKMILSGLALALGASLQAKIELVSVDSMLLMERSKAGQAFAEKAQKEKASIESLIASTNKELAMLQEEISAKSSVLSRDALQEKIEAFEAKRRSAERNLADKQDAMKLSMQRESAKIRSEQVGVMKKMCERQGWDALLEKGSAIFVSNALDKTSEVLKELDAVYEAKKSASPDLKKKSSQPKREIKVA